MIFNSPIFLFVFLPVALALFFITPSKLKNLFLVIISILFYTWGEGELIILLLLSVFFNYIAGLLLERYNNTKTAYFILVIAVLTNIAGLVFYKYTNFLAENLNVVLESLSLKTINVDPIYFPLGISFFTFQALSYIFDVYREEAPAEHNPVNAALYMTFFPKLISGPIIRYTDMKAQMDKPISVNLSMVYEGMIRFITGLAKKVIIADNIAIYCNAVFSETPQDLSGVTVWTSALMFGLQMYFDFSGYTDMAIGAGKMFGFNLPENFNFPYAATSISDFWRRWHISLSFWFRDYFYTPLSLILARKWNARFSIGFSVFLAFITIGLWHGAAWKFLIFGFIHAVFIMWEMTYGLKYINKWWRPLRHVYTLLIIIVSTVFFRVDSVPQALDILGQMFYGGFGSGLLYIPVMPLTLTIAIVAFFFAMPWIGSVQKRIDTFQNSRPAFRTTASILKSVAVYAILILSFLFVASSGFTPFIYFQF